jgi:hypothetical protein
MINPSRNQFETPLTFGHKVFDNKISDKQMHLYIRTKGRKESDIQIVKLVVQKASFDEYIKTK